MSALVQLAQAPRRSVHLDEGAVVDIREARLPDSVEISALIAPFAAQGVMLPKSAAQVAEAIDRYRVAVVGDRIVGSVGWRPVPPGTAEVVAFAVASEAQGRGVGGRLLDAILREVEAAGRDRVFAMTLRPALFERVGFRRGRHHEVPEKIRMDCVRCPRRVGCREILVLREPRTSGSGR